MPHLNNEIGYTLKEIISNKPTWLVRYGIFIFLILLSLLITLTAFIPYPEKITAPIKMASINPSIGVNSKSDGLIAKLFLSNDTNTAVIKNEPLFWMYNTTSHLQVQEIYKWLLEIENYVTTDKLEILLTNPLIQQNNLGELEQPFQDFRMSFLETTEILKDGYYQKKKSNLLKDLEFIAMSQAVTEKQKELTKKEFEIIKKEYQIQESLIQEKIIAPIEINKEEFKILNKQQSLEQLTLVTVNNSTLNYSKQKEIFELQKSITDQKRKFETSLFIFKSKIKEWLDKYIITAPIDGKVSLTKYLSEKQLVKNGEQLLFIQPDSSETFAEIRIPQSGISKVKIGQEVRIEMSPYPFNVYGSLIGKISYISSLPDTGNNFIGKVVWKNGLQTTFKKQIIFKEGLLG